MSESKEIFIVAGEHSGDLIGEMLVTELLALDPGLKITGLGGERMESAGAEILINLVRDLAIIGFVEVVVKFPRIYKAFYGTLEYLREHRPAAVVFIDYPGFNLRLAKRVRKLGIPVVYYSTPQVWAWHRSRLGRMSRCIDMALVILPFEEPLLRGAGIPVRFVGTPWLDLMTLTMNRSEVFQHFGFDGEKKLIGILPGSRSREVATHLPLMLQAAERIQAEQNDVQFVIVRASSVDPDLIEQLVSSSSVPVKVIDTYRYNVRSTLDFAIVVSGTATLETGLLLCPMLILYRLNALTWFIYRKMMISISDVGLINVVAGKRIVPELIGEHCTSENIVRHSLRLLANPAEMEQIRSHLLKVREEMGGPGASKRAAGIIHSMVTAT